MQEKLIDVETALDRLGGDREFLFELLHDLVDQLNEATQNLQNAVSSADYYNVRAISHGMKGAASNLGADRIAAYFSELEKKSLNEDLNDADDLIGKIRQAHLEMADFLGNQ